MSEDGDVPDSADTEALEEHEVREQAAAYRAQPLRHITALERDGRIAVLNCGHRRALLVWLREGDSVRCRECYEIGMERARRMVEGISQ